MPANRRAPAGAWRPSIRREPAQVAPGRFRLLNQEREITTWNDPGVPKLWLYHLHYLESPDAALIRRWIEGNPLGHGPGWEPYPLSRRIVNWIKWERHGGALDRAALESLALQARWLSSRVEHHLLGNHLLANAKALVFAGGFFEGAQRWFRQGMELLEREIPEQILADGAHFERSPMYHSIVLEDLLDLINLSRSEPWIETASRMLGWLAAMCHPDGGISFFNDAAFGVAPEPADLHAYARRLGIEAAPPRLGESGYIRLENENTAVIFDAAPIGPDYQPGHAHADTLSFELSHRGRREIVNSGISTYERGAERQRQRGTALHNTARVDGLDQSEVWAAFRVARRARPFNVGTDHRGFAEASHDGYARLSDPVVHRRRIELSREGLHVADDFACRGSHTFELFFHLAPESALRIQLDPKLERTAETTNYHPGFHLAVPNTTIRGCWSGRGPCTFRTHVPLS